MYKMTTVNNDLAIVQVWWLDDLFITSYSQNLISIYLQVPPEFSELTTSDVFLLDIGLLYYTFNVKTINDKFYQKEKKKLMAQNLIKYIREFGEKIIINIGKCL